MLSEISDAMRWDLSSHCGPLTAEQFQLRLAVEFSKRKVAAFAFGKVLSHPRMTKCSSAERMCSVGVGRLSMEVIKSMRNCSCTCTLKQNPFVKWSVHLNALKTGVHGSI